jgi:hypothetical protein
LAARPAAAERIFVVSQQESGREAPAFPLMNAYLRLRGFIERGGLTLPRR